MEAVPRLPMINFEHKISPENVDFASKLKQLISSVGEDPSSFEKEIRELETLRASSCIRVSETVEGVSTLKRYYCQLLFLKSRFKIGSDGPFQFSWRDIYSGTDYSVNDLSHELAAILYNIGALHSRLGVGEDRQDSDGMKMAVAHFQCSAWAFHTLPDQFPQDSDSDLASEVLAFKSQLCLAQAQECILEKSLLDCRKPGIVTKVCGQVVEYYKQALKQLEMSGAREMSDHMDNLLDIVGNRQSRNWRSYMEFKVLYYSSLSMLHSGMLAEEGGKWGERVSFYQGASTALGQAGKAAKEYKLDQVYKGVTDALVYCSDVVNGKLEISKKENEFIYHEKVPELDSLPTIKGASLVKGIPFDSSDPEVSGVDLFARIVPMEAHEASSLYSEELAKMLRAVCGEIEVANDSMVLYLSSMQLEDIPDTSATLTLPQELIECAAGLSVRPQAVSQLQEAMAKLASVSADVEASLTEIQQMLKEEEVKEGEFQAIIGSRPRSIMSEMERETQKYHQAHSMASESNLTLHKAMQLHVANLKLLARPIEELTSSVPTLLELDQQTRDSLEDMRKIMAKVEEMKAQRAQLEGQLRAAVQNDDITESLARKGSDDQTKLFEEELKKHDKTIQLIKQNIQAQGNIVRAMTERNAVYADARMKVEEVMRKREEVIGSLVASYHAYEDLLNKTTKGLEFYDKLDVNVSKLVARVGGVVKVQEEERAQQMTNSAQKAADARALSLSLISGGYKPDYTPGAPPPDTPAPAALPQPSSGGRPKLSDYLAARKNNAGTKQPDRPPPGIRPQPLGSESDPPHSSVSLPSSTDSGIISSITQPVHGMTLPPQYPSMHAYQQPGYPPYVPSHGGHHPGHTQPGMGVSGYKLNAQGQTSQIIPEQKFSSKEELDIRHPQGNPTQDQQDSIKSQQSAGQESQPNNTMTTSRAIHPQVNQRQHLPVQGAQQMYGQSSVHLQGPHSYGGPAHGQQIPGQGTTSQQMPGQGSMSQQMPVRGTMSQQMPGQWTTSQQMFGQGLMNQHILGQRTMDQQMPGQGIMSQQLPGHGTLSLHLPGQGAMGQRMPGQGTISQQALGLGTVNQMTGHGMLMSQQMPGQGAINQHLPGQGTMNHQMPGQRTVSQQVSGQGTMSQQIPGLGTMSQQIPGQGTLSQKMPAHETFNQIPGQRMSISQQMPDHGAMNQHMPGPGTMSPRMPGQETLSQHMPGQGTMNQQMPGRVAMSQQMPVQGTMSPQMPGQGTMNQQMPGQGTMSQHMPGQGSMSQQMPGQGTMSQQMPGQGTMSQQIPGKGTMSQQIPGQGTTNQLMPGQGTMSQHRPGQGSMSQQMPGQGTMSHQMPVQGTMSQQMPGQGTMSQHMPGHGTMSQQMAGQGPMSQHMLGQGTTSQQMPGQGTMRHQVSVISSQHMTSQYSGAVSHSVPGQGVPSLLNTQTHISAVATLGQPMHGHPHMPGQGAISGQQAMNQQLPPQQQAVGQPKVSAVEVQPPVPQPVVMQPQHSPSKPQSIAATQASNLSLLSSLSLPSTSTDTTTNSSPPSTKPYTVPAVPMPGTDINDGAARSQHVAHSEQQQQEPEPIYHQHEQPKMTEDDRITRLSQEVERMQNLVSNLSSKTLGGQSPLEIKWKEVIAMVESNKAKHSVSVARCYPAKNKVPDVLPYDQNRVILKDVKDDYINASRINNPRDKNSVNIITQAPASKSIGEFWTMVWQEGVETMVCLVTDQELGQAVYIPRDKDTISVDGFTISVKSTKSCNNYLERVINITNSSSKQTRAVMAVQMVGWPGPDLPLSPACLLDSAVATLGLKRQQRIASRPVLVHCLEGGSKSATFLTILWLVEEMESEGGVHVPVVQGWPDICSKMGHLMLQRKGVVRDKQYLKLVYECLLYYMQDILMKQGILNTGTASVLGGKKTHSRHPSQDFVGLSVANLKDELIKVESEEIVQPKLEESAIHPVKSKNDSPSSSILTLEQENIASGSLTTFPDDLSKLADITESQHKKNKKISKEDFLNPSRQVGKVDESDPLSQLDPLWSLK